MEVIFILLPATLAIAGLFVGLFIFSVNAGQFEELESPAHRMLFEERESSESVSPDKTQYVKTDNNKVKRKENGSGV